MDKAPVGNWHPSMRRCTPSSMRRAPPPPDEDLLHRLKKEKLRLKDAMLGH